MDETSVGVRVGGAQYLQEALGDALAKALSAVAKTRPSDPVSFLAHFLRAERKRQLAEQNPVRYTLDKSSQTPSGRRSRATQSGDSRAGAAITAATTAATASTAATAAATTVATATTATAATASTAALREPLTEQPAEEIIRNEIEQQMVASEQYQSQVEAPVPAVQAARQQTGEKSSSAEAELLTHSDEYDGASRKKTYSMSKEPFSPEDSPDERRDIVKNRSRSRVRKRTAQSEPASLTSLSSDPRRLATLEAVSTTGPKQRSTSLPTAHRRPPNRPRMAVPVVALRPDEYRARRGLRPLPPLASKTSSSTASTASTATQYYDDDYNYYDQNIDTLPRRRRPRPRKPNELRPLQEDFQMPPQRAFDMERHSRKNRQMLARLQIADNMV